MDTAPTLSDHGPLAPILHDLRTQGAEPALLSLTDADAHAITLLREAVARGPVLARIPGEPTDAALAAMRDAVWPLGHLSAVYRVSAEGAVTCRTSGEKQPLAERVAGGPLTALHVRPRAEALSQPVTRAKFDTNAALWNGDPGSPGYGHYRWMRRLLAEVARPPKGTRTLDAGCGTGWVGLEAARLGAKVSAFDPSPAMVELARRNAQDIGVELDARVGFVEGAPFDQPFEIVLNSGVISSAPDPEVFLARLDALVAPGGLLVIGDINPRGRGFRRRRRTHLLLPVRELNGLLRPTIEKLLVARGYRIEARRFYQLSFPVPELMALAEQRRSSLLCGLMLAANRMAVGVDAALGSPFSGSFDSWILRARKASAPSTPAAPAR
jgi:2-polyprenyl-3-methyl-5-hydroxy-6-metoxy-1,4-benzoquinol methylase